MLTGQSNQHKGGGEMETQTMAQSVYEGGSMSQADTMTPFEFRRWYEAVLANDENSTDAEMVAYFVAEGGMSQATAEMLVRTRGDYQ